MRDNGRDDICANPEKAHLWRLPLITEPPPPVETPSKRGIVILPLFVAIEDVVDVGDYYANAACWARRSWLLNTDAQDYGIDVIVYAENLLYDHLHPVLKANHLNDENILYFDGSHMQGVLYDDDGRWRTHTAKKGVFWTDWRFQEYEWVFQADCDLFPMPGLNFFERFFDKASSDAMGVMTILEKFESPPYPIPTDYRWCHDAEGRLTEQAIVDWRDRLDPILPADVVDTLWSREKWCPTMHSCLAAFPARHYMTSRQSDCEYLSDIIRQIVGDEPALSIWNCLGNPTFAIADDDIPMVFLSNRSEAADFENCLLWHEQGKPYFLHYGSTSIEKVLRHGIGAL